MKDEEDDSFLIIKNDDVKSAMMDEIVFIIKQEYKKDITTMDEKELNKFMHSIIKKRPRIARQIVWWVAVQCAKKMAWPVALWFGFPFKIYQ